MSYRAISRAPCSPCQIAPGIRAIRYPSRPSRRKPDRYNVERTAAVPVERLIPVPHLRASSGRKVRRDLRTGGDDPRTRPGDTRTGTGTGSDKPSGAGSERETDLHRGCATQNVAAGTKRETCEHDHELAQLVVVR